MDMQLIEFIGNLGVAGVSIGRLMTAFHSNMSLNSAKLFAGTIKGFPRHFPGKVLVLDSALFPDQVLVPFKSQKLISNVDFGHASNLTTLGSIANNTRITDALNHPFSNISTDADQPYGLDQWRAHFTHALITHIKVRWIITPQNQTDDTDSWDTSAFSGCHFIVEPISLIDETQFAETDTFQRIFFQNQFPAIYSKYWGPYDQGDGGQKGSDPSFIISWQGTPWYIRGIAKDEYFENHELFSTDIGLSSATEPDAWDVRLHVTSGSGGVRAVGKQNCSVLCQIVYETLMYDPVLTLPSSTGQT